MNAEADTNTQVFRVSPYLGCVEFDPIEYGLDSRSRMIYDELTDRQLLISATSYDALCDAYVTGGIISADHRRQIGAELPFLVGAGLLLTDELAFRVHNYRSIEIEINRHCNFRCSFCPVSVSPKPKALMSRSLFDHVLGNVVEYGARVVSLNHYSEPTLHPEFVDFCELVGRRGLKIRLHSNLSMLNAQAIERLAAANSIAQVVVNLPSADPTRFREITKSKHYHRVRENIELMNRYGMAVSLAVNAPADDEASVLNKINHEFAPMLGEQQRWDTDDRAGRLTALNKYRLPVRHSGKLAGCRLAAWQINISYEGKVFLCCQDFDQTHVVGDIRSKSLTEIAESPSLIELRRKIFGDIDSEGEFICRRCHKTSSVARSRPLAFAGRMEPVRNDLTVEISNVVAEFIDAEAASLSATK